MAGRAVPAEIPQAEPGAIPAAGNGASGEIPTWTSIMEALGLTPPIGAADMAGSSRIPALPTAGGAQDSEKTAGPAHSLLRTGRGADGGVPKGLDLLFRGSEESTAPRNRPVLETAWFRESFAGRHAPGREVKGPHRPARGGKEAVRTRNGSLRPSSGGGACVPSAPNGVERVERLWRHGAYDGAGSYRSRGSSRADAG